MKYVLLGIVIGLIGFGIGCERGKLSECVSLGAVLAASQTRGVYCFERGGNSYCVVYHGKARPRIMPGGD